MPRCSAIGRLMLTIGGAVVGTGCLDLTGSCGNDQLSDVASPGGAHHAVVFQRDCGASIGYSTQVSVLAANAALPDSGGNVFVADDDHGRAPAGPGGGPQVEVRWIAANTLEVRYDARARVFTREPRYDGIEVRFIADSARAP